MTSGDAALSTVLWSDLSGQSQMAFEWPDPLL